MTSRQTSDLVPRETEVALQKFVELATRWNQKINLFSKGEEAHLWERHVLDSAQLFPLAPRNTATWLDLGSGGGFPGIICAILAKYQQRPIAFTLVEADLRKTAFLREASMRLDLPIRVLRSRIEEVPVRPQDLISARALAPLEKLLDYAEPFIHPATILLFPKGRQRETELTQAQKSWHMKVVQIPSRTDADGAVLRISEVRRRS